VNFHSTEHPISWFRDRYRDGTLTIKPPYQRKPVWAERQKCSLIESVLLGLPIPEIYIQESTSADGNTVYAVVDGQQRIRSILQFIGVETDPEEDTYNKFILDKLDATSPWVNKVLADLTNDQKISFYGYKFSVRSLSTNDEIEVRDLFKRLNKFLTPLKPQELRNATFTGPFVNLAMQLADNEYWAVNRIVTAASIRRMGDVEFVSELLIGVLHGVQGGGPSIIDSYYRQYEDYEDEFPDQKRAHKLFDDTLRTIQDTLPKITDTRWCNKTDFYTLFIAIASFLRNEAIPPAKQSSIKKSLEAFAKEIDQRLADKKAKVSQNAIDYAPAVEKGANDKARRANRHLAITKVIGQHLKHKK
jgi:hypothetical protein